MDEEQIDEEEAYWLANSSAVGDRATKVQLLEKFCGRIDDSNALRWPHEKYACETSSHFDTFGTSVKAATAGRSFFVTGEGYMGLAPRFAEKGDLICVLLGCSVPVVIRKMGTRYVVLGDTYVYGMMHGEMMEEAEKGRLHVQWLTFE